LRALILAGGYGTRLGELTKTIPKALVEVGGIPIIDRTINKLNEIGITEITVNTHYLNEMVTEHLTTKFPELNLRIVFEPKLLGTAGTLKANIDWLATDDFIVMHGDNYFKDNLFTLAESNLRPGNLLRACTFVSKSPQHCGIFTLSQENIILSYDEKKQDITSTIANAAIYRFSKDAINLVSNLEINQKDISVNIIPTILDKIELVELEGDFIDIGTAQGLSRANASAQVNSDS
jgi:mannose-1-phosphate guanylyltransferase